MIYVLPGMGANSKMYTSHEPWASLKDVTYLEWPKWDGELSLSEIADRLIKVYNIKQNQILAGSSLGGMVALEISQKTNAKKTILIGSAVKRSEVNSFLLGLAPLARLTPIKFIQRLTGKTNSEFLEMFSAVDPEFIRHMCLAVSRWQGSTYAEIERIHGSKDLVIKCPENAHIIDGAGHLAAMTHPEECVSLIKMLI